MENYPRWVNNLVYFLAGIGFGHILFNCNIIVMPDMSMYVVLMKSVHLKETCYRYKAEKGFMQSFFLEPPYDSEKEKCDFYWPSKQMENGKDNTRV
jgi:hypothetical protein